MSAETDSSTVRWLWLAIFLLGWWAIIQLIWVVASFSVELSLTLGPLLAGAVACPVAWLLAKTALNRGAPRTIWIPVAIASLPLFVLGMLGAWAVITDPSRVTDISDLGDTAGRLLASAVPTALVYFAGRRMHSRDAVDTIASGESGT